MADDIVWSMEIDQEGEAIDELIRKVNLTFSDADANRRIQIYHVHSGVSNIYVICGESKCFYQTPYS